MISMLQVGDAFPEFELQDQNGHVWRKTDLLGKPAVLFFYPKDDTPGCTKESCDFRDAFAQFQNLNLFGVSPDPVKSHKKFATKFELPYPLLADDQQALCKACGVWVEKSMYGKTYMGVERTTYLLNGEGVIVRVWQKVKPEGHVQEVLSQIHA